jgi:putative membrane-bound dehydrogenase-like protein
MRLLPFVALSILVASPARAADAPPPYRVGVAAIDITPDYPVRLAGFGFRRAESEGVTQRIHAKALAIDDGEPAVLVTADLTGITPAITDELAKRLQSAGVRRERLAVTVTHTHTAPMVRGYLATLFGQPIPPEHQKHIDRFTDELIDKLERVAKAALADRKPARLSWGVGRVGFAMNRRDKGGPVDHDLPVLVIRDPAGQVRAVYASYACHCVTLSNNRVSGDWAGFAQEAIEADFPGAVALISIGCGADQNPNSGVTGDKVDVATAQGREFAREVKRLAGGFLAPVAGKIAAQVNRLELPLAASPPRSAWEEKSKLTDPKQYAIAYHARVQLARLDHDEPLKTKVDYPVQAWAFGDSLAMAFLPGEVVVDYALRLKRELDSRRLWLNAYSNDVPCYIPSERVLKEGRYEGGGAMVYYDLPGPFQPGLEQPIVDAVHAVVGERFHSPFDAAKTGGSRPQSPQQSQTAIQVHPGLTAELVAAEPLVASPVAIDFGPDGRLWVAEMYDYPSGPNGDYRPAGRVRCLRDTRGDGKYDESTIFLDNIPFPTGVTVWRKGVLVCAAPDILYAEDTDGDGKADKVVKLFSGFGTTNYQARVNSLEYGLDGWVYGACGLYGGTITTPAGKAVVLGHRDFRIKPDTGEFEPATGQTQQGRPRDDWGDWFGCDNTHLAWHYPLADHYLRRNPHAAPARTVFGVPAGPDPTRLFPANPHMQLFKLSGPPGRPTAVCGIGVYRDDLLGREFTGDLFMCEPVNLLVHRLKLSPRGSTFAGRRAPGEESSEFLASADPWFRPVQARTGPDGCLYVVDMYRYVIEHPRWIPPEDLAKLDVRAGSNLGRIYRVRPKDHEPRPIPRLDKLDTAGLVAALDSPNGWQRDLATQMLLWRDAKDAAPALAKLATGCPRPEARLHALCTLDGLGALTSEQVRHALADAHPGVRRHAARLAERFLAVDDLLGLKLAVLINDPDAQVRLQAACSLGAWKDAWAGRGLAKLALRDPDDATLQSAVLSSVHAGNVSAALAEVSAAGPGRAPRLLQQLLAVAVALDDRDGLPKALHLLTELRDGRPAPGALAALAAVFDALQRHGRSLDAVADAETRTRIGRLVEQARAAAADGKAAEADRLAAVQLLGRDPSRHDADVDALARLLTPQQPVTLQSATATALGRIPGQRAGAALLAGWAGASPALKSQILDLLLSRDDGQRVLLDALARNEVPAAQIDAAHRQRLLSHKDARVREQAAHLFAAAGSPDRQKVLRDYQDVFKLTGDAKRGQAVFGQRCSVCHLLNGTGYAVGPDLAALQNKSPHYLLQEILDPNRNVDSRYVEYRANTKAGRTFTGLLADETATSITLRGQEGREEVLLRNDLEGLESTGRSLMPEGLEKDVSRQDLADLLAYLGGGSPSASAADLARQLLDDSRPARERQGLIDQTAGRAAEAVAALVADLPEDAKEEYRRIPWVWRVAVAAGKRNDTAELQRLLDTALPQPGEPLRHWQAVAVGGGVINGISQRGVWPRPRIDDLFSADTGLKQRWQQTLQQAAAMADDEKVPTGTRYDALRIIALDTWERRGEQLAKYLAKGTNAELQMGAISGLADLDAPPVAEKLITGLEHYPPNNRTLALDALVRTDARVAALLDAVERGTVRPALLNDAQRQKLHSLPNEALRTRAVKLVR